MLLIFRWWYFLGLGGIALTAVGTIESKLAARAGRSPIDVTIESLQRGETPAQPYVQLGEHVALFGQSVEWREKKRVEWVCHPILPLDHPYVEAWREVRARHKDTVNVPTAEVPRLTDVQVFVKRKSRSAQRAMPRESQRVPKLEGMLFGFDELSADEKKVVRAIAPTANESRVFLLEAHRKPWPLWFAALLGVGGVLMIFQAIRLFRRPKPAV